MPTIAYLGPEQTNTHLAALKRFGRRGHYVHAPTVDSVFSLVEEGTVHYGVVPVENSLEGAVTHTLDYFIQHLNSPVRIKGEIEQPVRHYLLTLGLYPEQFAPSTRVASHPQALAQCGPWLHKHFPRAIFHETRSTSEAAWLVKHSGGAAIGTREIAKTLGLTAIPIPLEGNKTRFLVIGRKSTPRGRRNKTSVLFGLKDRPGALYDVLLPFKVEKINLTKIESRPSRKKAWEYYFFIDLEGYESEPRVKHALKQLESSVSFVRLLGSYPVTKH